MCVCVCLEQRSMANTTTTTTTTRTGYGTKKAESQSVSQSVKQSVSESEDRLSKWTLYAEQASDVHSTCMPACQTDFAIGRISCRAKCTAQKCRSFNYYDHYTEISK